MTHDKPPGAAECSDCAALRGQLERQQKRKSDEVDRLCESLIAAEDAITTARARARADALEEAAEYLEEEAARLSSLPWCATTLRLRALSATSSTPPSPTQPEPAPIQGEPRVHPWAGSPECEALRRVLQFANDYGGRDVNPPIDWDAVAAVEGMLERWCMSRPPTGGAEPPDRNELTISRADFMTGLDWARRGAFKEAAQIAFEAGHNRGGSVLDVWHAIKLQGGLTRQVPDAGLPSIQVAVARAVAEAVATATERIANLSALLAEVLPFINVWRANGNAVELKKRIRAALATTTEPATTEGEGEA